MPESLEDRLKTAIDSILNSQAPKILILAGPGAGKTTAFRKILQSKGFDRDEVLVLTFINNLKFELEKDLGDLSRVYTFHGYCHFLLRQRPSTRIGLTEGFVYYPAIYLQEKFILSI